jgi:choline dehydrogenase
VRLASPDPDDKPLIDFGFYQEQADFDTVLGGLHLLHDMVNNEPLRSLLAAPYLPMSANPDDAELTEHIRRWTQSMYHPAGTCAMGTGDDAVLDPSLRVRGVSGLRVVDASVMPTVTRGNTHAPTNMIAEKAADLIKS